MPHDSGRFLGQAPAIILADPGHRASSGHLQGEGSGPIPTEQMGSDTH